ncbi:hypothetical protein ColLi_13086 [Colletotrichum liriopes]|uniref:AB hydrolase-1 domain-containing protein n=1 Tax=Colletotrichum liriopes TaxID=708192 RepID=A0AA37H284_9PEZI|nr:hypothetical protein ColLi_13086 [Colletotrichum liriopes]
MDPNLRMSDLIDAIAALINGHAKTSHAHLVGLSFDGHLALRVAGRHPDRTRSVFASGVNRLAPRSAGPDWSMAFLPFLVWGTETFGRLIPSQIRNNAMSGRFCPVDGAVPPTLQQIRNLLAAISAEEPVPVLRTRVVLLAATKTGRFLEDAHSVQDAQAVFKEIQPVGSEGGRCVTHSGLTHSWVKGHPKLLAETVAAVVKGSPIRENFSDISMDENGK